MKKLTLSAAGAVLAVTAMLAGCAGNGAGNNEIDIPDAGTSLAADVTEAETPEVSGTEKTNSETQAETAAAEEPRQTEPPEETEEPVSQEPLVYEPTLSSVIYANSAKNSITARFTGPERDSFEIGNQNAVLTARLKAGKEKTSVTPANSEGKIFAENAIDNYILTQDGTRYLSSESFTSGRMNSYRLGYYYWDVRIHDLGFVAAESGSEAETAAPEKIDHLADTKSSWGKNDVKSVSYSDHIMKYVVESDYDPYITSSCRFSCDDYTSVHIVIKTEKASVGQFFIIAGSEGGYNAPQSVTFNLEPGVENDITVPINAVPDYNGSVRGFRVDVGAFPGEIIEISTLEFVGDGPLQSPVRLERIFHTYPDKIHEQTRLIAASAAEGITEYGETITLPADSVVSVMTDGGDGLREWTPGETADGLYAAAADVKDVGIIGFIIPDMYRPGAVRVERIGDDIVITHYNEQTGTIGQSMSQTFAHQLYISDGHDFTGFAEAVRVERNPLAVTAISGDLAGSRGYDPYSGQYVVTLAGTGFNQAYYDIPDKEFSVTFRVEGDGKPRKMYIEAYTENGGLECAALLDSEGKLMPIPAEVSKNFCGEFEEPFYDPADLSYGETRFVMMSEGGVQEMTVLNLYQNWGDQPLRQLSSIQFHIPYYHLSYGVTETNCIAPFFVFGRDGWTLPDFRAQSAPLWDSQPQHTSVGRLYLPYYTAPDGTLTRSELQKSVIDSAGPVYPDVTMDYLLDGGKIKASYRHLEMPWSDENRTMYSYRIDVTDDVEIADFARDFRIFEFDGRGLTFTRLGYLDENNSETVKELSDKVGQARDGGLIRLGSDCPYFDYYLVSPQTDTVNFGLIIKSSDIVIGGEKFGGRFVLHDMFDRSNTVGALSLDLGAVTLKKGDHIYIDLILLPWGTTDTPDDSSVRTVRQDTCLDPYKISVSKGELIADPWMPKIRADGGKAEFTVSGGSCGVESGNALAVRVYGFEKPDRISVTFNGETAHISPDEYQDMQVYYDADGTYSFSFVVTPEILRNGEVTVACGQG